MVFAERRGGAAERRRRSCDRPAAIESRPKIDSGRDWPRSDDREDRIDRGRGGGRAFADLGDRMIGLLVSTNVGGPSHRRPAAAWLDFSACRALAPRCDTRRGPHATTGRRRLAQGGAGRALLNHTVFAGSPRGARQTGAAIVQLQLATPPRRQLRWGVRYERRRGRGSPAQGRGGLSAALATREWA